MTKKTTNSVFENSPSIYDTDNVWHGCNIFLKYILISTEACVVYER